MPSSPPRGAAPRAAAVSALLLAALALAAPAAATQFHDYGDFTGATVLFKDVEETTADAPHPAPPLFGAAGVAVFTGDVLTFNAGGAYLAERDQSDGIGTTSVASNLNLELHALDPANDHIDWIILREFGDFDISQDALATVSAQLFFKVTEVDNGAVAAPSTVFSATMTFVPAGSNGNGSYDSSDSCGAGTPPCAPGGVLTPYEGTIAFDVTTALGGVAGLGFSRGATKIEVFSLNNQLNAIIEDDGFGSPVAGSALIQKKIFDLEVVTVPEPGTAALLALGLAGLAARRRARR